MLIPQSWIVDLLQRPNPQWSATAEELDAGFVSVGFEVEGVPTPLPEIDGPLVLGRVQNIEELTGFKKPIRFCQVDVGNAEPQSIVCGARNFAEGDLVVVALPGCVLPGGFAIGARETYGKLSAGMICSVSELGIGNDHSGILVLDPATGEPGQDAREVLGLDDTVIEVNITPDRGYAFSLRGLSRELAAGFGIDFQEPEVEQELGGSEPAWPLQIQDDAQVTRFAFRRVTGIDPSAKTPWWIVKRLLLSGVRPISPAVDVTNYVMLELGQPLHAFDTQKLSGPIVVRRAQAEEKLTTLDGVERALDLEDVVIADDSGVISLAGIMGGQTTEVSTESTDILLEAAVWQPLSIFRSGRRHKLSSEASKRFERHVDPGNLRAALDRAATLLVEIAGGTVVEALNDEGGVPQFPAVSFPDARPSVVAGYEYPAGTTARRLKQVGCEVEGPDADGNLTVTPPSWRPDLKESADLVEEVLRLEGLDVIPSVLPQAPAGEGLTPAQHRRRGVSAALASTGFVEVLPSPFMNPEVLDTWNVPEDDARRNLITVLNPLESDRPAIASTLLPALSDTLRRNISRGQRDVSIYAIAQATQSTDHTRPVEPLPVDRRPTDAELAELHDSLPVQDVHVAIISAGLIEPAGTWGAGRAVEPTDMFDAARLIGEVSGSTVELRSAEYAPWHPGRCAAVEVDGITVGYAGELHPVVCEAAGLPPRTCALELNLSRIPVREQLPAPRISPFPPVLQDVAVVVADEVPAAEVERALRAGGGEFLEDVRLFDIFHGEQVGAGRKSLTYSLTFRAEDRTMTEEEATAGRDGAVAAAAEAVGAVLRGSQA